MKAGAFPGTRTCAVEGCDEPGHYRAPKTRAESDSPDESFESPARRWQYLCLEHVRAFNARWNWFEGASAEEIRAAEMRYAGWERATRQWGEWAANGGGFRVDDSLGVLRWKVAAEKSGNSGNRPLPKEEREALARLGLGEDATLADIKQSFRRLARRYHPDANGGNRQHEARFRALSEAYHRLCQSSAFGGR